MEKEARNRLFLDEERGDACMNQPDQLREATKYHKRPISVAPCKPFGASEATHSRTPAKSVAPCRRFNASEATQIIKLAKSVALDTS